MNRWQDTVLSVGSLIFTAALIPTIRSSHKPALSTSLITAIILGIYVIVYSTLSLWFTTFAVTLTCLAWSIIAVQKFRQNKGLISHKVEKKTKN